MKTRLVWLDNLKGVLIVLVVLGHCIQHTTSDWQTDILFRYIYSFHMPLFMFVSGYACFRENVQWKMIGRRFLQLMTPFFVWTSITALMKNDFSILVTDIQHPEQGLWFLWALFFITVIHVIGCRLAYKLHCNEEIVNGIIAICLLATMRKVDIFCYPTIAKYFVYYVLGFYARKYYTLNEKTEKTLLWIAIVIFLAAGYFSQQGAAPSFMPENSSALFGQLYNMAISFVAIYAFMVCLKKMTNCNVLILSKMGGGATLGIYAIHRLIMGLFPLHLFQYDNRIIYYALIILLCCVTSLLSYLIINMLNRNKISGLLFNGNLRILCRKLA